MTVRFTIGVSRAQRPLPAVPFKSCELPDGTPWIRFCRTRDGYLLRFPELADFLISTDCGTVNCWPAPGMTEETIQHLYRNQVVPLLLSQQGKLVFHASAVDMGGLGIAFVGPSGRGKSTLAASFSRHGDSCLVDDGMLVESIAGELCIVPSHPSIRLWQDSQEALADSSTPLAPPVQFTAKARILAGGSLAFSCAPRPLKRIYFLGDADTQDIRFERLSPREALLELIKHSFLLDPQTEDLLSAHFRDVSQLANLSLCYSLDYPRRYEDLPAVRHAIREQACVDDSCV